MSPISHDSSAHGKQGGHLTYLLDFPDSEALDGEWLAIAGSDELGVRALTSGPTFLPLAIGSRVYGDLIRLWIEEAFCRSIKSQVRNVFDLGRIKILA
jgi:hypothetical protein